MIPAKKIISISACLLFSIITHAEHPNREQIDSLKKLLPKTQGIEKVNCLNALSKEYWWLPRVFPDSISCWAEPAYKEAVSLRYPLGEATALMHKGVSEIYRKKFLSAESLLLQALRMLEDLQREVEVGWCHLWLGQALYSQTRFKDAIEHYHAALSFTDRFGEWEGKGKAWTWMGFCYAATGNYDSSFDYCIKSLTIRQKMSDHLCISGAMVNMGHLYKVAGAYDDALDYYRQGLYYAASHSINFQEAHWNYLDESLGIIHGLLNEPDSSVYYLQNALQIDPDNLMTRIAWGETLLAKKQYDSALTFFLNPIERFRKESNKWDLMRILMNTAKAYEGKRNLSTALSYAHESLSLAKEADIKQYMLEGSHVVSRIHQEMRNPDSAYFYLQQYAALKDSVMRKQSFWRLSNYKKQADFKKQFDQIALLDKDNKIKEEQLKRESLWKWILVAFFLVTTLLAFIVYKNLALKRKNEKLQSQQKQAALQQHVTDLEMQALRAQMNPHFVFNCLSSINRFILKNETEAASDYLTKFSRLIRMVLTHSRQTFITLDEELEMLRLYLDMERLRFKDSFDYSIRFTNSIDAGAIYVPPMLLQPFAENAIWHGLMHKDGQRELEIELSVDDKTVTCMITDNGIGRARAAELKSKAAYKQKSMGLEITTQRLALLNINGNQQTFFTIEDLTNDDGKAEGTQVILKINYRDLTEVVSEIA